MASRQAGSHHSRSFTAAPGPGAMPAYDTAPGHRRAETSPTATMASRGNEPRSSYDGGMRQSRDGLPKSDSREGGVHRLGQQQAAPARQDSPVWAIAEDVFEERYQQALVHTEGSWRPITQLYLSLDSPAAARTLASTEWLPSAVPVPGGRPATAAAALLMQQHDPWQGEMEGLWGRPAGRSSRPRLLFQYKPYCQQEPLNLSEGEVAAVVDAVFGPLEGAGSASVLQSQAASLWDSSGPGGPTASSGAATTGEVAAVVLIKLVMDLYIRAGPRAAFPLALMLLQKPLVHGQAAAKARCFHLLYNLSVHGELLFPPASDAAEPGVLEAEVLPPEADEPNFDWRATVNSAFRRQMNAARGSLGKGRRGAARGGLGQPPAAEPSGTTAPSSPMRGKEEEEGASWPPLYGKRPPQVDTRAERFQQWLRLLLYQLMSVMASLGSAAGEGAWAAALSCLVHLSTYDGWVVRAHIEELPLTVVAALLERCRQHRWSEQLHAWLILLAANLLYSSPTDDASGRRTNRTPSLSDSMSGRQPGSGHSHRRAASFGGSFKGSAGGGGGGGERGAGGGPGAGDSLWWASAKLDPDRLHDFGGMRQVLNCYRESPTAQCRQSMFAVVYDYITGSQAQNPSDAWAPILLHSAHPSEVSALGAALLRVRAGAALHPLFLAGGSRGLMQRVADAVGVQMAANQVLNPGRIVSVPTAFVSEVLECLEDMAASWVEVPPQLDEVVRHTLEAVTTPEGSSRLLSPAQDSAVWDSLLDLLRDPSPLGHRVGTGWLTQLLVAAAEAEVLAGSGSGGRGERGGGAGGADALLPEVATGGCQLDPGRRGIRGQERLRDLLQRLLATADVDNRAAGGIMAAVSGLLATVRLRCRVAWLEADEQGLLESPPRSSSPQDAFAARGPQPGGAAAAAAATPSAFRTPEPPSSRPSGRGGLPSVGGGGGNGTGSSAYEDEAVPEVMAATPGDRTALAQAGSGSGGNGSPIEDQGRAWQDLDVASAVLSTICLAVEWLLLAPLEARQSGMLQAAQLLLTFLLQRQPPLLPGGSGRGGGGGSAAREGSGGPGSRQGGRSSDGGGGGGGWRQQQAQRGEDEQGGSLTAEGSLATVVGGGGATPGRGLRVDIPEDNGSPVQVQGSALMSSSTQAPLSSAASGRRSTASPWLGSTPVNSPPPALGTLRPGISPGRLPSFTAAAAGAGGAAAAGAAGGSFSAGGAGASVLGLLRPGTPSVPGGAPAPRGVEVDVPAATAAAAAASAEAAEQQRRVLWEAMAAAEERGTRLWSFLNGLALVPLDLLSLVPPLMLLTLFEDLKPETGVYYPTPGPDAAGGAGVAGGQDDAAGRLMQAADLALGVKATVQADRALWDARAAMLLLLMARCTEDEDAMQAVGGPAFFGGLLQESDQRIRHYASIFVLRQLLLKKPQQYRRALRQIILRAQAVDDERLVANPYLQVKAMIDLGLVDLTALELYRSRPL